MSLIECDHCQRIIDSDDDPECFCDVPDYAPADIRGTLRTAIICEPCREKSWERHQEAMMEHGP